MTMSDLQGYHWNLYLINIIEDIFVFLGLKMFVSVPVVEMRTFVEKSQYHN